MTATGKLAADVAVGDTITVPFDDQSVRMDRIITATSPSATGTVTAVDVSRSGNHIWVHIATATGKALRGWAATDTVA